MTNGKILAGIAAVAIAVFAFYMIDIDQTEEASLPDVDVTVEGGNLPEFEADMGDIDIGTEEVTVTVPTIDVETPEEDQVADNN